jgi:DNA-binding transcriptional LysR family regulator
MELDHLRTFLTLVERGSVSAASETLGTSRGTVRRRIEELEARVGLPLLVRAPTGVVPTTAGQTLLDRGRLLLQEAASALQSVREAGSEPAGTVRVVAPVGMPPHVFPLLVMLTGARYPRLSIDLRLSNDPLSEALEEVDIALHFGARPREGPFISKVFTRMPEVLVASPDYLASAGTPTSVADLADHPLFVWRIPGGDPTQLPTLTAGSVTVQPRMVSSDVHLLRHLAMSGLGIAFVPDRGLDLPDALPVVPVLPEVIGRECALRFCVPEALVKVPKVRAVMEVLDEFVRGLG